MLNIILHAPVIAVLARKRDDIESGAKLVLHKYTIINIIEENAKSSMHINFSLYFVIRAKYIVTKVLKIFVSGIIVEMAAAA